MANILNYLEENYETFEEREMCDIDSLIFSQLSYLFFDGMIPELSEESKNISIKELLKIEKFSQIFSDLRYAHLNKELLFDVVASPRFRNVEVNYYINEVDYENEKQFSAMTFILNDKLAYVAFRGTDNTFLGWKEDFNMSFMSPVPAQEQARKYLNKVSSLLKQDLFVGGHSKGGNLAVYASMKSYEDIKDRIIKIYNHDGPGFNEEIIKGLEYSMICDKISKTVPVESIIGMIMESKEKYIIVKSNESGILQHDPFSWEIVGKELDEAKDLANSAIVQKKAMSDWINSLDHEKKIVFVNTLYKVIDAMDSKTVKDPKEYTWQGDIGAMINATRNLDSQSRKVLFDSIKMLVSKYFHSLGQSSLKIMKSKNLGSQYGLLSLQNKIDDIKRE